MRKIAFCIGIIFIVVRHREFLAQKKKAYEAILTATPPPCTGEDCKLRKLNALVKTLVAETRLMEAEREQP